MPIPKAMPSAMHAKRVILRTTVEVKCALPAQLVNLLLPKVPPGVETALLASLLQRRALLDASVALPENFRHPKDRPPVLRVKLEGTRICRVRTHVTWRQRDISPLEGQIHRLSVLLGGMRRVEEVLTQAVKALAPLDGIAIKKG